MQLDTACLFQPFKLGPLALRNRIVMAPMTRSFSPGGVPGADVAAYYRLRAQNEVGLIITEGTLVDHPAAGNDPNVPHFYGTAALDGWARVLAAVHAAQGRIMPQLWHVGSLRRAGDGPNSGAGPISASGLFKPGKRVSEPASLAEIDALIAAYATSAGHAHRLGFDGIELHCAHGYLVDQFLWAGTNERTDAFGGDLVRRTHLAARIVRACRQATAPDFPIAVRFSQWKQQDYGARLAETPAELATLLAPLTAAGADIFHCSTRRFWEPEFPAADGASTGDRAMNLAGWTKKLTGKPVITVGSIGLDTDFIETFGGKTAGTGAQHLERLTAMVHGGEVDLVAVGRALITDPAWAVKLRDGRLGDLVAYNREALAHLV